MIKTFVNYMQSTKIILLFSKTLLPDNELYSVRQICKFF